jgi:hypothetical protein
MIVLLTCQIRIFGPPLAFRHGWRLRWRTHDATTPVLIQCRKLILFYF